MASDDNFPHTQIADDELTPKRKAVSHRDLEQEELDLLEENTGVRVHPDKAKKRKLQRASALLEEQPQNTAKLQRNKFQEIFDTETKAIAANERTRTLVTANTAFYHQEDSEEGDFIVEDEDHENKLFEVQDSTKALNNEVFKLNKISEAAVQEAAAIFGDLQDVLKSVEEYDGTQVAIHTSENTDPFISSGTHQDSEWVTSGQLAGHTDSLSYSAGKDTGEADVPERIRDSLRLRHSYSLEDFTAESKWIAEQLADSSPKLGKATKAPLNNVHEAQTQNQLSLPLAQHTSTVSTQHEASVQTTKAIEYFLTSTYVDHKEWIHQALYCKDYIQPLLDLTEIVHGEQTTTRRMQQYHTLRAVIEYDKLWNTIQRRKHVVQKMADRLSVNGKTEDEKGKANSQEPLKTSTRNLISRANTLQQIDDIQDQLRFRFHLQRGNSPSHFEIHRPQKQLYCKSLQSMMLRLTVDGFGLTSEQFAENTFALYQRHEVRDPLDAPLKLVEALLQEESYAKTAWEPQSALKAATHLLGLQIATEPKVRAHIKEFYGQRATVSTLPTPKGKELLTPFHRLCNIRCLLHKPLPRMSGSQYLQVLRATDEGLITASIGLSTDDRNELLDEMVGNFSSQNVDVVGSAWNSQRKMVLEIALDATLKIVCKQTREQMLINGKEEVAQDILDSLWTQLSMAPFCVKAYNRETGKDEPLEDLRVLAATFGAPSIFIQLDKHGNMLDYIHLFNIGHYSTRRTDVDQRLLGDMRQLNAFMVQHQPHVCVIGASQLECRALFENVETVVGKIVEENPRGMADDIERISVIWGDQAIPKLWEGCMAAAEEFPEYSLATRRTIATARMLYNVPALVASLCREKHVVTSLCLHKEQKFLQETELRGLFEYVLIAVINQIGVSMRTLRHNNWQSATLPFVAGLGFNTSKRILEHIEKAQERSHKNSVEETISCRVRPKAAVFTQGWRSALIDQHVIGHKTFYNMAPILQFEESENPLDHTRIHPDDYKYAVELSVNALAPHGIKEVFMPDTEKGEQVMIRRAMADGKKLSELKNISVFAKEIEIGRQQGRKLNTLYDIREELRSPFEDSRESWMPLTTEAVFFSLTGESADYFKIGAPVQCKVQKIGRDVQCTLDCGISATIRREDVSDLQVHNLEEHVTVGQLLTARIKDINFEEFHVELVSKSSTFSNESYEMYEHKYCTDLFYSKVQGKTGTFVNMQLPKKASSFVKRNINHPLFHNVSMVEAFKILESSGVGDIVIRPSSKGTTHLTLTCKFYDQVYSHVEIRESMKGRDGATNLQLGVPLSVGDTPYEDLDEIVARFVEPYTSFLKKMLRFRKFRKGSKAEIDEALQFEKRKQPNHVPYCFSISYEHGGYFTISYVLNRSVRHEYIQLTNLGYKFRNTYFADIENLVTHFKLHCQDIPR
mmetsp:Transcript_1566/g.5360  ORF Transcript_1566/g.5360 Transcript_1566/m.5360 type:complete len:1419 (+) Transcript_1566:173-4429(+)|eukprot:CAMPEP_0183795922 /NCGR_PEP_ID=MMETSP0803_2-20130417/5390_1 /TAXON_ID=195967 /ORGANISM="Crustomastix stigmata, Strain CCMP3273" /LENGTH=1418 /DNA_ID=CAMNT_0026040429 /DNA_START=157 /DNA_END=4413 /DNA_ORIENTATION=+